MKPLAFILLLLIPVSVFAQDVEPWYSFYNADSTLSGFKDANGMVKIEPKFRSLLLSGIFRNIIAVTEQQGDTYAHYYLTKSGRKVGRDSVHYFDNTEDYEQEGFIRFRDRKSDKVGLFNRHGDIVVPAIYDGMTSVHNGMIIALFGANKLVSTDGEHHFWKDGRQKLIDTSNKVLIEDFKYDNMLNLNSLKISSRPDPSSARKNFKGTNGQFYSFIEYESEFKKWLEKDLLDNFSKEKLSRATFGTIANPHGREGWVLESKETYIEQHYERIQRKLLQLKNPEVKYSVTLDDLNPYIYESQEFQEYLDVHGQDRMPQYPVLMIVIDYDIMTPQHRQDFFEFLRTKEGYKLISATMRKL